VGTQLLGGTAHRGREGGGKHVFRSFLLVCRGGEVKSAHLRWEKPGRVGREVEKRILPLRSRK